MNCVGHQSQGLWRHPRDRSSGVHVDRALGRAGPDAGARLLRRAVPGRRPRRLRRVRRRRRRRAAQRRPGPGQRPDARRPVDGGRAPSTSASPSPVNMSFEPPYTFARRMSTLDHLTDGPGRLEHRHRLPRQRGHGRWARTSRPAHDDRYDMAEEYLEVVYRLWEGSWEDDAVVRDRTAGVFADPAKVHRVAHDGELLPRRRRSTCPSRRRSGRPCCSRPARPAAGSASPPATPSACSSPATIASRPRPTVARLREDVAAAGRDPDGVSSARWSRSIVDETTQRPRQTGPTSTRRRPVPRAPSRCCRGGAARTTPGRSTARRRATRSTAAARRGRRTSQPRRATSPWPLVPARRRLARRRRRRARGACARTPGVDGFNLTRQVVPETFMDFVDLVVPELQRRGVHRRDDARARCAGSSPPARPVCRPRIQRPATATRPEAP